MTYEFEYLMHLFACGSRGLIPQPPRQPVNFDRLIQLAQEHSVLPLVGAALCKASDFGFPIEKVRAIVNITRKKALANFIKRRQIFKLLEDFEKAGIQAVLLKGYAVADLYAEPDCRISSDTDIYVNKKNEKRAYRLLKEHGFKVIPRSSLSHHAVCEHPQIGIIELHVTLYPKNTENVWFRKMDGRQYVSEAYEKYESEDGNIYTLGKTDTLLFLVLHMIKHFIHGGISMRQMMDIALYMKTCGPQIDFKRLWTTSESLKYKKLMNTVLSAMVIFGGFSPDDFRGYEREGDTAVSAFLNDLETGGWLGKNEIDKRKDAGYIYNRSKFIENENLFIYRCYIIKRIFIRCYHATIPKVAVLETKYPYAKKARCLIPIAWIQHMISGVFRLLVGKYDVGAVSSRESANENIETRIQLFRLMKMM